MWWFWMYLWIVRSAKHIQHNAEGVKLYGSVKKASSFSQNTASPFFFFTISLILLQNCYLNWGMVLNNNFVTRLCSGWRGYISLIYHRGVITGLTCCLNCLDRVTALIRARVCFSGGFFFLLSHSSADLLLFVLSFVFIHGVIHANHNTHYQPPRQTLTTSASNI